MKREVFEETVNIPDNVMFKENIGAYVWKDYPRTIALHINDQWESFCDGWDKSSESWLHNEALTMIEEWNKSRQKANLTTATEGSLLDGIASLLSMIDSQNKVVELCSKQSESNCFCKNCL